MHLHLLHSKLAVIVKLRSFPHRENQSALSFTHYLKLMLAGEAVGKAVVYVHGLERRK